MGFDRGQTMVFDRNQGFLQRLVSVFLWTAIFTLAYAQSPLYTSNQNQYFLHGLAKAGYGFLNRDWLANTLDPTPVFSALIYLTARIFPWEPVYYFQFALLAGIYFFSLFGILSHVFPLKEGRTRRWFYMLALILVHSAALRYLVVRLFNQDWVYLFDGGLAGQRLLGSVLQPSTFGVLLLCSVYFYLRGNIIWAVISLVLAPTFHPTYLLSAAVLTLVYIGIEFKTRKDLRRPLFIGMGTLLGVIPILLHTFRAFGGSDPMLVARARELMVDFRIPHHAIPAQWFNETVLVKLVFLSWALLLTRRTRLFPFLLYPFLAAVMGTFFQIITAGDIAALIFPWRLSTWLVPLSVGVILFWGLGYVWNWIEAKMPVQRILVFSLISTLALAGTGLAKSLQEYQEKLSRKDLPVMGYVNDNKTPEDVYVIPLDMQDFRLETGAPVYVEFKSIPYKDVDVLEWYRRVSVAGSLYRVPYKRMGCEIVAGIALEGATHIVLPYDHTIHTCSNLEKRYGDGNFEVYVVVQEGSVE
jgi:hypothetical protein